MIERIKNFFGFSRTFGAKRNSGWAKASKAYRIEQPLCEMGWHKPTLTNPLQTHHEKDVSTYPQDEMKKSNWINLCHFHHLWNGHLGNYRSINPNIRGDIVAFNLKVKNRR